MYQPTFQRAQVRAYFGARTVVLLLAGLTIVAGLARAQDNCKVECYPNTRAINSKNGVAKGDNCRWILRTDGKAARLCDHIKCKKVCPAGQGGAAAGAAAAQDQQGAASDNMRIEQQTEPESPNPAGGQPMGGESMGIMRNLHGAKLAKAPVPGVAGGRLAQDKQQQPQSQSQGQQGGRRMAPTLPPAVQYDENDTPPPISRFLDISPEE